MTLTATPTANPTVPDLHFVTIYALDQGAGQATFLYGNVLPPITGLRPQDTWTAAEHAVAASISILSFARPCDLGVLNALFAAFERGDAIELVASPAKATRTLAPRPPMVRRPPVIATIDDAQTSTPLESANELHETYWSENLRPLFEGLIRRVARSDASRAKDLHEFFRALHGASGVVFDPREIWRLGSLEIVRPLFDPRPRSPIIASLLNDSRPFKLSIRLEGPIDEVATHILLRVGGGSSPTTALPVIDRLFVWSRTPIVVDLPETGVTFSVDVYGSSDGALLAAQRFTRVQGLSVAHRAVRFDEHLWLPLLPEELRQHVIEAWSTTHTTTGAIDPEPWVNAQGVALAYADAYFPRPSGDVHLLETAAEQKAFVRGLIESAGGGRLLIVDPYFDASALRLHFVDNANLNADIEVITSLKASAATVEEKRAADGCTGAEPAILGGVTYLRPLIELAQKEQARLPLRMRILNLQSESGGGQQFHDRFIRVQRGNGRSELWWLGSSLNSIESSFPLFAIRVRGQQRLEYDDYVRRLGRGEIAGRPTARLVEQWRNVPRSFQRAKSVSPASPEMRVFPGWRDILQRLANAVSVAIDISNREASVQALVGKGVLASYQWGPSWHLLGVYKRPTASAFSRALATASDADLIGLLLRFSAFWSHGGADGDLFTCDDTTLGRILKATSAWVSRRKAERPDLWSPATDRPIEIEIVEAANRLEHQMQSPQAKRAVLAFVRDLALSNNSKLYWSFLSSEACEPVYQSLSASGYPDRDALVSGVQSRDVRTIAEVLAVIAMYEDDPLHGADEALGRVGLPAHERAFAATALVLDRRQVSDAQLLFEMASIWTGLSLSADHVKRLTTLLDSQKPGLTMGALEHLAGLHPEADVSMRDAIIATWTRYLAPPQPARPFVLREMDGYAQSRASSIEHADLIARQYASRSHGIDCFLADVAIVDLRPLTMPKGLARNPSLWKSTAHRAMRVSFVALRLLHPSQDKRLVAKVQELLSALTRGRGWTEGRFDFVALNVIGALAHATGRHMDLDGALDAIIRDASVPTYLRLRGITVLPGGVRRYQDVLGSLVIDRVMLGPGTDLQRRALVDILTRPLGEDASEEQLRAQLESLL